MNAVVAQFESLFQNLWIALGFGFGAGLMLFLRYVLLVATSEWLLSQKHWTRRRLSFGQQVRKANQTRRELRYAAFTSVIFGLSTVVLLWSWASGYLAIYDDWHDYPLWWIPVSLLLAMLIHETYYYWLHRAMHHPVVYPWLHRGHHDSIVTSGWTSFAFDPGEAVFQAGIIPLILIVVPMHWLVLVAWLLLMTLSAIINHTGVEVYPRGMYRHWLGRQFIGATHHGLHHTRFNKNYGLYFTFWDRWMGTEAEETQREFARATD